MSTCVVACKRDLSRDNPAGCSTSECHQNPLGLIQKETQVTHYICSNMITNERDATDWLTVKLN